MGVPVRISTFHSVLEISERQRRFGRRLYRTLQLFADYLSTAVVAVTEPVADHLRRSGISADKINVIHNGIDVTMRTAANTSAAPAYRIAIVGRLVPVKAHSIALEALAMLSISCPSAEYLIIGEGPERAKLQRQAAVLGLSARVQFVGFRDDVQSVLRSCDLICMPSLSEGLPFAALEAATLGLPMVASNVGGLTQHFVDYKTARLVEPGSARLLAEALLWSFNNRAESAAIGLRARQFVADHFSLDRMLSSTLAVYGGKK